MSVKFDMKEVEYERLKNVLTELKDLAKAADSYEDSIFSDYQGLAESYKRDIIDILLELEI